MWLLYPASLLILNGIGHSDALLEQEQQYILAFFLFSPVMFLNITLNSYYLGIGRTSIILGATAIATLGNAFADYLLIFGNWGFPELGIFGAGMATAVGHFIAALFFLFFFRKDLRAIPCKLMSNVAKIRTWMIMKLVKYGLPSGLSGTVGGGAFMLFVLFSGHLGDVEQQLSNVAMVLDFVIFVPIMAFSQVVTSLVGQYIGAGRLDLAIISVRRVLIAGLTIVVAFDIFVFIYPEAILIAMNLEPELYPRAIPLLYAVATYTLADLIGMIVNGAFNGAGDTKVPMYISIIIAWVYFMPLVSYITFVNEGPLWLMWFTAVSFIWLVTIVKLIWYFKGNWKRINLIANPVMKAAS
jgi:multidrug resistance protein, MATE family